MTEANRSADQRRIRRRRNTVPPTFGWAVLHPTEGLEIADYVPCLYRTRKLAKAAADGWKPARPVKAVVMILPELKR